MNAKTLKTRPRGMTWWMHSFGVQGGLNGALAGETGWKQIFSFWGCRKLCPLAGHGCTLGSQFLSGGGTQAGLLLLWGCRIVWCTLTSRYLVSLLPVSIIHVSDIFLVRFWSWEISFIMWGWQGLGLAGGLGLGFRFPWNGGIPRPHRGTWSQPINVHLVKARGSAEKPAGAEVWTKACAVCTNRIALQTCNQSLCNPYVICW